jgi:hypothetical protein
MKLKGLVPSATATSCAVGLTAPVPPVVDAKVADKLAADPVVFWFNVGIIAEVIPFTVAPAVRVKIPEAPKVNVWGLVNVKSGSQPNEPALLY